MNHDISTMELAKLYELQGYYKDAREMYLHLDAQETGSEIQAGIERMNKKLESDGYQSHPEEKISFLFEKWLMIVVLRHRLDNFIKIKKRLA